MLVLRTLGALLSAAAFALPMPVRADDLPPAVTQSVDQAISAWAASGNLASVSATVKDLCSAHPGVALDIVAYAGEKAVQNKPAAVQCLTAQANCTTLDELLAYLYQQALMAERGNTQQAALQPSAIQKSPSAPAAQVASPSSPSPAPAPAPVSTGSVDGGSGTQASNTGDTTGSTGSSGSSGNTRPPRDSYTPPTEPGPGDDASQVRL